MIVAQNHRDSQYFGEFIEYSPLLGRNTFVYFPYHILWPLNFKKKVEWFKTYTCLMVPNMFILKEDVSSNAIWKFDTHNLKFPKGTGTKEFNNKMIFFGRYLKICSRGHAAEHKGKYVYINWFRLFVFRIFKNSLYNKFFSNQNPHKKTKNFWFDWQTIPALAKNS